jgi:hypothetical protein
MAEAHELLGGLLARKRQFSANIKRLCACGPSSTARISTWPVF